MKRTRSIWLNFFLLFAVLYYVLNMSHVYIGNSSSWHQLEGYVVEVAVLCLQLQYHWIHWFPVAPTAPFAMGKKGPHRTPSRAVAQSFRPSQIVRAERSASQFSVNRLIVISSAKLKHKWKAPSRRVAWRRGTVCRSSRA